MYEQDNFDGLNETPSEYSLITPAMDREPRMVLQRSDPSFLILNSLVPGQNQLLENRNHQNQLIPANYEKVMNLEEYESSLYNSHYLQNQS